MIGGNGEVGGGVPERADAAFGTLAESAREAFGAVADSAVATQQQNIELLQDWIEGSARTFKAQAEISERTAQALIEQFGKQQGALCALAQESAGMWMGLFYPFVSLSRSGRETGKDEAGLPIDDYDRLGVEDIVGRLGGLRASEVERLKAYERHHRNRPVLLERFDYALV